MGEGAVVLYGINNIYTVRDGPRSLECRIKGKVLGGARADYNPLAPGDQVLIESVQAGQAYIISRLPRRNSISRWNKQGKSSQVMAANIDQIICVAAFDLPPFRPRFIDRVAVAAENAETRFVVCMNKLDLGAQSLVEERLAVYEGLGYQVLRVSVLDGRGMDVFMELLHGRVSVLVGQSGVGKSSLVNLIFPGLGLKTAPISRKYLRGCHTTVVGRLEALAGGGGVIDTPGIREFDLAGIDPHNLQFYFREFPQLIGACLVPACSHVHEPGCAVQAAVEAGSVSGDRYESYRRIHAELCGFERIQAGRSHE